MASGVEWSGMASGVEWSGVEWGPLHYLWIYSTLVNYITLLLIIIIIISLPDESY